MTKGGTPLSKSGRNIFPAVWALLLAACAQFFFAQKDSPWTLWTGLAFYFPAIFFLVQFSKLPQNPPAPAKFSARLEFLLLGLLSLLALFFRLYRLQSLPDGVFADRAEVALGALRILQGRWHPFLEALNQHVPELWIYYLAAGWFWLFGSSPDVFSYFDVFLSVAGLCLAYAAFRQLSGPRTALLAFFFLAFMRWNFVFARKIYFQSQTVFFSMLALTVLLYALRRGKSWLFAAAGFFLALGLYSYQACKAFPVFIFLCMAFEFFRSREEWKKNRGRWFVFWLSFLVCAAPLLSWMIQEGSLGRREAEVSIFSKIRLDGSLSPLVKNLEDGAAIFNRRYDTNSQSNYGGRRMLDDGTGALFLLALAWSFLKIKQKPYFYGLSGFFVMSLPALFSENGGHAGRMLGLTPFIAYLCSLFLGDLYAQCGGSFSSGRKGIVWGLGLLFLAGCAVQNDYLYFTRQSADPAYLSDFSWPESKVGGIIGASGGRTEFFLPSRFYGHPTVEYLSGPEGKQVHSLDPGNLPLPESYGPGKDFYFPLDDFKMGVLGLLKSAYPGGETEAFQNPLGETLLYAYRVPAPLLEREARSPWNQTRGLVGDYRHSPQDPTAFLTRLDPVVNFTFRDLPSIGFPLFIRWTGKFLAPRTGDYGFQIVTYENASAQLTVDGKQKTNWEVHPSAEFHLKSGWHEISLAFQTPPSPIGTVDLLWKRPGNSKYEFMPNGSFGEIKNLNRTNP